MGRSILIVLTIVVVMVAVNAALQPNQGAPQQPVQVYPGRVFG